MRHRARRGFSFVELLLSTAILMLVVLIAVQMLSEAGRLTSRSQVELAEPSVRLVTQWLRRDIQGAAHLGGLSFAPTSKPLDLEGHREGLLRYELDGTDLQRAIVSPDGEVIGRRTVLRGVAGWRWRSVNAGLVEVEIVYRRRVPKRSTPGGGSPVESISLVERRRFALRGGQRRTW